MKQPVLIIIAVVALAALALAVNAVRLAWNSVGGTAAVDFDKIVPGTPLAVVKAAVGDYAPEPQPDGSTLYYALYADGTRELDAYVANGVVRRVLHHSDLHNHTTSQPAPTGLLLYPAPGLTGRPPACTVLAVKDSDTALVLPDGDTTPLLVHPYPTGALSVNQACRLPALKITATATYPNTAGGPALNVLAAEPITDKP